MKTNRLLQLVQTYFDDGYFDVRIRNLLRHKVEFSDEEIDYMWDFVFKVQRESAVSKSKTMTIKKMKTDIGILIGQNLSSGYAGSTVSRADLYKIYQFITSLPEAYLKDRANG